VCAGVVCLFLVGGFDGFYFICVFILPCLLDIDFFEVSHVVHFTSIGRYRNNIPTSTFDVILVTVNCCASKWDLFECVFDILKVAK